MAVIVPTVATNGAYTATQTTMTASDTMAVTGNLQTLILNNSTAGILNVIIDGDGGTTVNVDGLGAVDVSAGLTINMPIGAVKIVKLSTIREYLKGNVTLTGGTGIKAILVNG